MKRSSSPESLRATSKKTSGMVSKEVRPSSSSKAPCSVSSLIPVIKGSNLKNSKGRKVSESTHYCVQKKPICANEKPKIAESSASCKLVMFSPGKLDTWDVSSEDSSKNSAEGDCFKRVSSQLDNSTCVYSDIFFDDVIFEDPEEDDF
uniref:Uncharacterized protein n=1 Tax=Euplotes harpa TaxID=151035 RepID=A0A7S3JKE6_9SPIT|mmetsp:Transcript_41387/g.47705  ORF Transcript_41387/g.47705 Transcript_41387/m.47705 type:complete len:148 (+) Transcript_41387:400-843(+)